MNDEVVCHTLRSFDHLRFVRQLDRWPYEGRPSPRSLPGAEVLGYTLGNGCKVSRVFYIIADETDGITATPAADKYGGVPIVPRSIACGTPPMLYETEIENERLARAEHVRFWRDVAEQPPAPETKRPNWLGWLKGER